MENLEKRILEVIGDRGVLSHFKPNESGDGVFVRIGVDGGVGDEARSMKKEIDVLIRQEGLTPTVVLAEGVQGASKPAQKTPAQKWMGLNGVKRVIAVASGKGGVGKSSVTVAIARMLAQRGEKVGVLDADIYGPSIPTLFGVEGEKPLSGDGEMIEPIISQEGIKLNSIGFFVEPQNALVWRGPMATSALKQLIHQTEWGEVDTLLLDMPPGTGDIHLTIAGEITITGAVIVTTPSALALADVIRGIDMLQNQNIAVPILGIVNNMAYFQPLDMPEKKYNIFGEHTTLNTIATEQKIPILANIPLQNKLGESINPQTLSTVL